MGVEAVPKIWTILSLLTTATDYLKEKNIEDPRLNAELLLAHTLNLTRVQLYLYFEKPVSPEEVTEFRKHFHRRAQHEPLQYIIGETEFYGLKILVNKNVLIPRPETEILVEEVIRLCASFPENESVEILDIGTGSGNIPTAIAAFAPNAHLTTLDCSTEALTVAKENAAKNNVAGRIDFIEYDILSNEVNHKLEHKFNIIVSNPPYVSLNEYSKLEPEVNQYEPGIAVTDNGDGFRFYNQIAKIGRQLLKEDGKIYVEVAYNQSEQVKVIFEQNNYKNVSSKKDYNGIERIVICSI